MFDKVVWLFKTAPSRRVFAFFINLYIRGIICDYTDGFHAIHLTIYTSSIYSCTSGSYVFTVLVCIL